MYSDGRSQAVANRPKADRYALFLLASLLDFELSGENGLSLFPIPSCWTAASVMVIAA